MILTSRTPPTLPQARGLRLPGTLLALLAGILLLVPMANASAAARPPRDAAREASIVAELRSLSPEAVPDFQAATAALDAGDDQTAAAGYRRVLERVPDFDAALRRLGGCLTSLGQGPEGIALQERAVAIRRTPENLASLAQSLAVPPGGDKPSADVLKRALALVRDASLLAPGDTDYLFLKAQLELQLEENDSFKATSAELSRLAPDQMATHYLAAIRAAMNEEWLRAEREIREAGRLGLPPEAVREFLAAGVGARALAWRWGSVIAAATGLWILGLALMFFAGKVLSTATLASIERDDPNLTVSEPVRRLRAIYRHIVTTAGLYWYVSLPFVAILVVAVSGGVIYGFLVLGRIPIKLVVVLAIGAIVSLYAIVRSLFIRVRDDEDPGRAVTEADAPGLWRTAREVAEAVGTRPIDEIWLTPGTDLAVLERGGTRQRMTDSARRALLLGAGVLDGFEQGAFRAVLAHEYGHFAHRDTAGGDVALRVRGGMMTFAIALGKAGFAVWWNLAFQFLRLYDFLFRRISHGATRLQEVLADRVAIQRYGFEAFRAGLTHVVQRSVLFDELATAEIGQAVEQKRRLANLYSLAAPSDPKAAADLEQRVSAELQAETSEDNTHPSPKDRFRIGQRVRSSAVYRTAGPVWELFRDPAAITSEMTALVASRVAESSAAPAAAD